MKEPALYLDTRSEKLGPYLQKLADLFTRMEKAYDTVAAAYGFQCSGCEDNCCRTLFFHHTLLEYLYLYQGVAQLPDDEQTRLQAAAVQVNREIERAAKKGLPVRVMCPLNRQGRCTLYRYRPMICRLHGIPNQMRRPDGSSVKGSGCGDFDRQCGQLSYIPFDRTPFYAQMAGAEKALREQVGFREKIRLTVAQMIAGFPPVKN